MLKFTFTRKGVAAIGKRNLQQIGRNAIGAAAMQWFERYLPLHFQNIAYLRYRYAPRDKRTNVTKRVRGYWPFGENNDVRAIGEVLPLVFTGRSREQALSGPNIRTVAPNYKSYRADVVINARAFNFGAGKRIDMRDEVTRFTKAEESAMEKRFAKEFELGVARFRGKKTMRLAA